MAHQDAMVVLQPGVGPFDDPAACVANWIRLDRTAGTASASAADGRDGMDDATASQVAAEAATIIALVGDQTAVYIARAMVAPTGEAALADYVSADPRNFPDVPSTGYGDGGTDPYWAYTHIEYCVEHGIVQGYEYPDPDIPGETIYLYEPLWPVTRDQMAVYIARAFGLST